MKKTWKHLIAVAVVAGLGHAGAANALAQACMGIPSSNGQYSLGADFGFADGAKSYGVSAGADLVGPLGVSAGYALTDIDGTDVNANSFGGSVGYELPLVAVSACPVAGADYMRISNDFVFDGETVEGTISTLTVPIGVGLAKALPLQGGNLSLTPFVVPQFLHIRTSVSGEAGGVSAEVTDSINEFGADVGVIFGSRQLFARGGLSFTTIEDSDPTFSFGIGMLMP